MGIVLVIYRRIISANTSIWELVSTFVYLSKKGYKNFFVVIDDTIMIDKEIESIINIPQKSLSKQSVQFELF